MAFVHVAFYRGTRRENPKSQILDNAICFFTGSQYSHAELVLDYYPDDNTGNCWSSSERDGGVRNKRIHLDPQRWVLVPVETQATRGELFTFFFHEHGKKYDYLGALGVVAPVFKGKSDRWFCFEIVATSLGYCGASRYNGDDLMGVLNG